MGIGSLSVEDPFRGHPLGKTYADLERYHELRRKALGSYVSPPLETVLGRRLRLGDTESVLGRQGLDRPRKLSALQELEGYSEGHDARRRDRFLAEAAKNMAKASFLAGTSLGPAPVRKAEPELVLDITVVDVVEPEQIAPEPVPQLAAPAESDWTKRLEKPRRIAKFIAATGSAGAAVWRVGAWIWEHIHHAP